MIRVIEQRRWMATLMIGLAVATLLLVPLAVQAAHTSTDGWIDQLAGFVLVERSRAAIGGEAAPSGAESV